MKLDILTAVCISGDIAVTVIIRNDKYFISISILLIQILAMTVLVESTYSSTQTILLKRIVLHTFGSCQIIPTSKNLRKDNVKK